MNPITGLLAALAALTAVFLGGWARAVSTIRRSPGGASTPATETGWPTPAQVGVGALTNFFDTLGIGSFATTTALFRALRMVPDRVIPGTLNAGHTLPTVVQAFIYTSIIPVDVLTLIAMITAAVLGAWLGAGVVAKWPKYKVQMGMGLALIAAALLMVAKQYGWPTPPPGDPALGVRGIALVIAVAGNFMLGALMTLGIGLYAPCMILVSFLGMSEATAFPDHDGLVRVPDAGREPALHSRAQLQPARVARPGDRRHPRCPSRRLHREIAAPGNRPLAGHRRRALHGDHDALLGVFRGAHELERGARGRSLSAATERRNHRDDAPAPA